MFRVPFSLLMALALVFSAHQSSVAGHGPNFSLEILVDGRPVRQYQAHGTRYVEGLKGREYAIRLHNPLDVRVAVALTVDGLNTIDARRTTAQEARKWVLDPGETVTITGWQVSGERARRFYFTSEQASYAASLGSPDNIGIVSAAVFRERAAPVVRYARPEPLERDRLAGQARGGREEAAGAPSPASPARSAADSLSKGAPLEAKAEDYAATGIGRSVEHRVQQVHVDLESTPAAVLSLRYEFRPALVRLGILPSTMLDPLERRQRATGFEGRFCPDPK